MSLPTNLSKPNTVIAGTDALAADINGNLDYITTAQNASNTQTNTNTGAIATLSTDKIDKSSLDIDPTLSANSDAKIPTQKAVKAHVLSASFQAVLPDQAGNSGKFVTTDGTNASWAEVVIPPQIPPSIIRSARTSNTMIGVDDLTKLIDITSGTFTQTFDAAATLGNGWYCYICNAGTGDITLDPNGSETIDGVMSGVLKPQITLLIICDGVSLHCVRVDANKITVFLTSGTSWTCPLGVRQAKISGTGGGGGGARTSSFNPGQPGGASGTFIKNVILTPGITYNYSIGSAGAAGSTAGTDGVAGGNTSITISGTTYTANGGLAGSASLYYVVQPGSTSINGDLNIRGSAGASVEQYFSFAGASYLGTSGFGRGVDYVVSGGYGSGGVGGTLDAPGKSGQPGIIIMEY